MMLAMSLNYVKISRLISDLIFLLPNIRSVCLVLLYVLLAIYLIIV